MRPFRLAEICIFAFVWPCFPNYSVLSLISDGRVRFCVFTYFLVGNMSIGTTKRNKNAQFRRSEILAQALDVFATVGFRGADVQVIADRANVGKGTVYRHFTNKEQLFLATARWCLEQLGEFIEDKLGGETAVNEIAANVGVAEVLKQVSLACAEFYQQQPHAVEMMIMERAEFRESVVPTHLLYRAEARSSLDLLIAAAIDSGEFRQIDPSATLDAWADLLFGNIVNGCIGGCVEKLKVRIEKSVDLFLAGLVATTNVNTHLTPKVSPQ